MLSNRQNGTNQVLIQPHASGHSVHDDADPSLVHEILLPPQNLCSDVLYSMSVLRKLRSRASGPNQKITIIKTIVPASNIVRAHGYPKRSRNTNSMTVAGEASSTPSW